MVDLGTRGLVAAACNFAGIQPMAPYENFAGEKFP